MALQYVSTVTYLCEYGPFLPSTRSPSNQIILNALVYIMDRSSNSNSTKKKKKIGSETHLMKESRIVGERNVMFSEKLNQGYAEVCKLGTQCHKIRHQGL
jgi:hypothetical protein